MTYPIYKLWNMVSINDTILLFILTKLWSVIGAAMSFYGLLKSSEHIMAILNEKIEAHLDMYSVQENVKAIMRNRFKQRKERDWRNR